MVIRPEFPEDFPQIEARQGIILGKTGCGECRQGTGARLAKGRQKPRYAGFLPHQCGIPGALTVPPL